MLQHLLVLGVSLAVYAKPLGYLGGDLVSTTIDPTGLNIKTSRTLDLAGRLVRLQAPLGQVTQYQYDALNELLKTIDPLTSQTNFTYDGNGNLLTVQDANTHTTTYVPNSIDKVGSRKDALLNQETYQYDLNGNPSVYIDRKNQVAQYTYDALDRLTQIQFADLSTITYTYDAGNRLTQIVDSINGTITRTYDGLDRLTSETTPQGSVGYTYDNANRRSTMTVAGQPVVNYTYDNANRLTQITQGTATVTIGYDFGFIPEPVFTFIPESCSTSSRNTVRNHPGIAFTLPRIPHLATEIGGSTLLLDSADLGISARVAKSVSEFLDSRDFPFRGLYTAPLMVGNKTAGRLIACFGSFESLGEFLQRLTWHIAEQFGQLLDRTHFEVISRAEAA